VSATDAIALLRCPHCGAGLHRAGGALRCERGHSFDVARQGYVSLLAGDARPGTADSAAMVAAREAFLAGGHFEPLARALVEAAERAAPPPGCLVDVGAGTGWLLARLLDAVPGRVGLALELAAPALRRAARAHERLLAVGCDAWGPLPLRDDVAALVLSAFAPRNGPETARILRPGGALLVVTPTRRHLAELVEALGLLTVDERKEERLAAQLEPHLEPDGRESLEWTMELDHAAVGQVAGMGPSAHHVESEALAERLAALPDPVAVSASVTLWRFRCPNRVRSFV
jgi:23S rRNA (guanine745-N1)-methyltransferase